MRGLRVAFVQGVGGKRLARVELGCCISEEECDEKRGVEDRERAVGKSSGRRRVYRDNRESARVEDNGMTGITHCL